MYLMLGLKLPIIGLFLIVWWAVKAEPIPETEPTDEDGGCGSKRPRVPTGGHPHRRGPHGEVRPPAPSRTRPLRARARRTPERHRTGR